MLGRGVARTMPSIRVTATCEPVHARAPPIAGERPPSRATTALTHRLRPPDRVRLGFNLHSQKVQINARQNVNVANREVQVDAEYRQGGTYTP